MIYKALKKFVDIFSCNRPPKVLYYHSREILYLFERMCSTTLDSVKEVDIDSEGTFKYILIKVYSGNRESDPTRVIVRGYKRCAYHSDIYDEVTAKELNPKKLEGECLGGGRIQHESKEKKMKVYGYSQNGRSTDPNCRCCHKCKCDPYTCTYRLC